MSFNRVVVIMFVLGVDGAEADLKQMKSRR
jgi:hypothetical protein